MFRFLFYSLCFIAIIVGAFLAFFDFDPLYQLRYDFKTGQKPVTTITHINKTLESLLKVPATQLPPTYLNYSKYDQKPYTEIAKNKEFYFVENDDRYKFLVGKFRVKDFMTKDSFLKRRKNLKQYILLDTKMLHKLLELQQELEKEDYDSYGFKLTSGFRHPRHNEKVRGASKSRHIYGQAIDLTIKDIDKNGVANQKDKSIVLDILEKKVIKNEGGIGRYPNTMSVHFDTRGYRARWDSY